ncbi:MAG: 5-dehydro-2-deoxygluconokinase [Jatrophihabitans sp.]
MTEPGIQALTVGRVGVDLYPQQSGVPLAQVTSFARSLGGTATNVAVAAAQLGTRTAVLTKLGADDFAPFVRSALAGFGVSTSYVGTAAHLLTPVTFCALNPPADPPLLFYRLPTAPDLTLSLADIPFELVQQVPLLWVTGTGMSVEPARGSQLAMLTRRGRPSGADRRWTVLDLDWRPMFWEHPAQAREQYDRMLDHVNVVVGNRAEVEVATGTADAAEAARRLLARGLELVFVKQGADGVLVASAAGSVTVAPILVEVVCGLGAGDAFGGALVHGLLAGWDPVRCAVYGNAAGAIVVGQLACAEAMPSMAALREFVAAHGGLDGASGPTPDEPADRVPVEPAEGAIR